MNLSNCKRVVLFNLVQDDKGEDKYIEFRHYGVSARQRSVNKTIKRLINNKKIPNLSKYNDIADLLLNKKDEYSSGSEAEDLPDSKIILPEDY
jgi:ribosome biogenesis protein SSF1/2